MPSLPHVLVALAFSLTCWSNAVLAADTRQATGVKIGEVTQDSAHLWVRITSQSQRNGTGTLRRGRPQQPSPTPEEIPHLEGEAPGAAGKARVRYGTQPDLGDAQSTPWVEVGSATDFTHEFVLTDLVPGTRYYFATDTAELDGTEHAPLRGHFGTAPAVDDSRRVLLTVLTCEAYHDMDDHPLGHRIYQSMLALAPDFTVPNGDIVYLDSEDPLARSVDLARYHWHRMYSMPRFIAFHLATPGYWTKDDHDLYANDGWPEKRRTDMEPFTYEEGLMVNREQTPTPDLPYRTIRWGRHLQIWLTEGREFRSPNTMPDGPEKSIWGSEQKQWFKDTVLASDADWKLLISPTPIVGPDRANKEDNHTNESFATEGREIRRWIADHAPHNLFCICGDRHWQFHSVDPATGVQEFSVGPASDDHASGTPGYDPAFHRFHRVRGGFLSVEVVPVGNGSRIHFRLHDVDGRVVYEQQFGAAG